jgi:predicted DNA-binding transcriptional regulator YafY
MTHPGSQWTAFRRCLAVFQRLAQGPATKAELMRAARELAPGAYEAPSREAAGRRFERDVTNLKERLGAAARFDRHSGRYVLDEAGPLLGLGLSPGALRGLAFLLDTFDEASAAADTVRPLLEAIQRLLPPDQLRRLQGASPELDVDLRHLDRGEIAPGVWEAVRRAASARRLLRFEYVSTRDDPPVTRTHEVEPERPRFREGHWALPAYCRRVVTGGEERLDAGRLTYRLTRIRPESVEVMPDKFTPRPRPRGTRLVYRLGRDVHRGGVSARFEEMQVSPAGADGWVTVTARTDDLFAARRVLLAYGENCQVLAPPELRRQVATAARKMAGFYEEEETPTP